jgi:hypothetical protein
MRIAVVAVALALALAASGCGSDGSTDRAQTMAGGLPQGGEPVKLDAARFTTRIDNPYWPMAPGTRWIYREPGESGGALRVEVTVTSRIEVVAGVRARVVHDVVTRGGELVEDTYDWYAQDRDGNVWYLGEATKEYEDGKVKTTEGSWEAGVDGAQAGIIMPARPRVGMRYRQEYYEGHAEDRAEVVKLHGTAAVPAGRFADVLVTRDSNPLADAPAEHKHYARGVGPVLTVSGGGAREELLRFQRPRG